MAKADTPDADTAATDTDAATKPAAQAKALTVFTAPNHVTAIAFSTGRVVDVTDGALTAPNDLSDDERLQLTRAGFVPA
jgi:hypothetical protein